MNRLFFDLSVCQPNAESKFHGGGVYGMIVFMKLVEMNATAIVAYYYPSRFLDKNIKKVIEEKHISTYDGDKISFKKAFEQSGADLIYSPLYSIRHDDVIKSGAKFVVTIHGLRSLEMLTDKTEADYSTSLSMWLKAKIKGTVFGRWVYKRNYDRYKSLLDAPNVRVVTVSNHSKYSIKCYYPQTDIDKIDVFYSPSTTIENYKEYDVKSEEKYYLIISANRWLKNAGRGIAAFDLLFDTMPDLCSKVKVLGLKKETKIYKDIRHKDKFELLGYQTQEDLERLYAGAYAFVYPTLNEGFGYPPLEAMKYGTPVVSAPFSSIPEVCGDAVLYANPYSVEEIANRVLQLENRETYEIYQRKATERYDRTNTKQISDLEELCILLSNKW